MNPGFAAAFDPADPQQRDAILRQALLALVEIGVKVARTVRDESDPCTAAEAFERVSRAVRRTVRMVRWLDEPAVERAVPATGQRVMARKQILRAVEDQIDRDVDAVQADGLQAELLERLDGAELEDDLAHRPVAEIIAEIVSDLGLRRMPGRRAEPRRRPDDIAALHARAAAAVGATRAVVGPLVALGRRRVPADGADDGLAHWRAVAAAVPETAGADMATGKITTGKMATGEMATGDLVRLLARGRLR